MAAEVTDDTNRDAANRMAAAADAWLDGLDPEQRRIAAGAAPAPDAAPDEERRRWFYTPTDHGGLTLQQQRPAQQRRAVQPVASRHSPPRDVSAAAHLRAENVLHPTPGLPPSG